ncbi:exonuclease [Proteus phage vB_PmiP_Pm5460]|uniref:Exonuclease n=1 Tax=Proteus phage vB_PmiP_Pm5460 TaxID=1636249 RepID=A0A0G2SS17_9CAUD|nr:endonuclease VII [Proteus phage vB_PmiP_Pm5460]AKA61834.1 exonuclease [Proteus phage vB_PmiP_Pm5460]
MATKLKASEVATYKEELMKAQKHKCPLCGGSLKAITPINRVLDHDHQTGFCRAVVCRGCNGAEGKILNVISGYGKAGNNRYFQIQWLKKLLAYWEKHQTPQTDRIYHNHKTEAEKREARNKKARLAYARKKEVKGG